MAGRGPTYARHRSMPSRGYQARLLLKRHETFDGLLRLACGGQLLCLGECGVNFGGVVLLLLHKASLVCHFCFFRIDLKLLFYIRQILHIVCYFVTRDISFLNV